MEVVWRSAAVPIEIIDILGTLTIVKNIASFIDVWTTDLCG